MGQIYRHLFTILSVAIIAFIAEVVPSKGANYTVYFESEMAGKSAIFRFDPGGPTKVTVDGCEHPSVTSGNDILMYTRIAETAWGKFWNTFFVKDGVECKFTENEIYDELDPVISRDGTWGAFTSLRNGNLEIITQPLDMSELANRITNNEKPDEEPSLATGANWIVWTGRTGNHSYIFRSPARGGEPQRLSKEGVTWDEHPSVSADGRWIVYSSIKTDDIVPAEGIARTDTEPAKYPGYGGGGTTPAPAPEPEKPKDDTDTTSTQATDEDKPVEGNSEIWILDTVTGVHTQLTDDPAWDGHASISADGMMIVFTSDRDGNYEIYRIDRYGNGLIRLTDDPGIDDNACIS